MKSLFVLLMAFATGSLLAAPPTLVARADEKPAKPARRPNPDPATQKYADREIEGWSIRVNELLLADKDLSEQTLRLLKEDLSHLQRILPAEAIAKLRKVKIWVELDHPAHPCACYHESANWLREHNMDVKKAKCVEIANARNYLSWTRAQPVMMLHELAHAYHDQFLGYENEEVRTCYDAAVSAKNYESVLHYSGTRKRHYALTNHKEYFAEATEAYFGTNDFFPFVRPELKEHDPRAHAMIRKAWGIEPGKKTETPGAKP